MSGDALRLPLPAALGRARRADGTPDTLVAALTDERLLRLTAAGDNDAFQQLVRRYEPRLQHFVRWYAGERDVAAEIVQEILLQVFRSASSVRSDSSVRTWVYGVARNVCRNYRRDHCHEAAEVVLDEGAFERMPPEARLVLTLRDWENLSYAEIAEVLDVPLGAVRSRIHNARARLALALAQQGFSR